MRRLTQILEAGLALGRFSHELATDLPIASRAAILESSYRKRRDEYEAARIARGVHYEHSKVAERTRARLASRGVQPRGLGADSIATLSFIPMAGWHHQLLGPLRQLGPVHNFDLIEEGVDYGSLFAKTPQAIATRNLANSQFLQCARERTQLGPIDWVFVYASGVEILPSTLLEVGKITGAPVVGMCLDDKQSWDVGRVGTHRGGQIDIADAFDLVWTSARVACDWYLVEGGNPLFLPEGCSPDLYSPGATTQDIDVSFVGQAYGFRRQFISYLRELGVKVTTAGNGWPEGPASEQAMLDIFRRSKIILGMGGVGWAEDLKNVKGRDFDGPCMGSAAYLTSYNPDLAAFFDIGSEIACYSTRDEAVELCRQLLSSDTLRAEVASAGRARCLRDHTWLQRFHEVLRTVGVLPIA